MVYVTIVHLYVIMYSVCVQLSTFTVDGVCVWWMRMLYASLLHHC